MTRALLLGLLCPVLPAQPPPAGENTYRYVKTDTAPALAPQISTARHVTFQLHAPQARKVEIAIIGVGRRPLALAGEGRWSVTVGPLEPEIYVYNFIVDGLQIVDPANPDLKIGRSQSSSLLEIPGEPPRFDQAQDVPQGRIHRQTYRSAVMGAERKLVVYLPPGYEGGAGARRYPVLYLRHGNGDLEGSWTDVGRAGVILDNLIARQKAVPMIVVMPHGYPSANGSGSSDDSIERTAEELLREIIPLVERDYRVLNDRDHRAIAGLSMGGGQAFLTGLRHPGQFAWVGEFSSGVISDRDFRLTTAVPGLAEMAARGRLRLLFLSCGTEDPRFPGQLALGRQLEQAGLSYVWFATPGNHEWKVWRHSLADFLPRLFQPPDGRQ